MVGIIYHANFAVRRLHLLTPNTCAIHATLQQQTQYQGSGCNSKLTIYRNNYYNNIRERNTNIASTFGARID
ncbi:hypothetical protein GIB67_019042 [Kingdonia uniflora]|uniref:Uncharacterized protein n=1 Tax=Kingdonia uniflora TaxID=39325 RepID=A0A7J7MZF1_9MAGN|nr:hypothetical protein GIB67_019042 [Kingdonia uniflora]